MAKRIDTYRAYTTNEMKIRSDIPAQADISEQVGYINCSNIKLSEVKTLLSEANFSIYDCCNSANVNVWSNFAPVHRQVFGGTLSSDITIPYHLGDFAGYNHTAVTPGWITGGLAAASADIWINSGSTPSFVASVVVSEIDFTTVDGASILGICLAIYDGASNIDGHDIQDLEALKDEVDLIAALDHTLTAEETFTGKIWFVSDLGDFTGAEAICRLPNTADYSVTVKIKAATHYHVIQDVPMGAADFVVTGAYFTLLTGTAGFTNATNVESFADLLIEAKLFNWLGVQVGTTATLYSGAYTAGSSLGALNGVPLAGPIDDYGYECQILFSFNY
jgi:hypothetical protein